MQPAGAGHAAGGRDTRQPIARAQPGAWPCSRSTGGRVVMQPINRRARDHVAM